MMTSTLPKNQIKGQAIDGDNPFTPRFIMKPDEEGNIYWFKWKNRKPLKINNWIVLIDKEDGEGDVDMTMIDFYKWVDKIN